MRARMRKKCKRPQIEEIEKVEKKGIAVFGRYWEFNQEEASSRRLLGMRQGGKIPVNMAGQIGVYILYEREKAVYVGKTDRGGLIDRLEAHSRGSKWERWDRFSWFGLRAVNEETGELQELDERSRLGSITDIGESLLIEILEPRLNRQSGNSIGEMYVQVREYVETVGTADRGRRRPRQR